MNGLAWVAVGLACAGQAFTLYCLVVTSRTLTGVLDAARAERADLLQRIQAPPAAVAEHDARVHAQLDALHVNGVVPSPFATAGAHPPGDLPFDEDLLGLGD